MNEQSTYTIVLVPNEKGNYETPDGARVSLHRFPPHATVSTSKPKFEEATVAEVVEAEGLVKVNVECDLPDGLIFYEELSADERFSTVEALIDNQDELTDINGIGPERKKDIINHVTKTNEGE